MELELRALLQAGLPDIPPDRINWAQHPQDSSTSYIVLHLISTNQGHTMQGPDGLERSRVQIDCYARNFGDAMAMGRAVKAVLDFHRDGNILGIFFDDMRLPREAGTDVGDGIYNASLDFFINWRRPNG